MSMVFCVIHVYPPCEAPEDEAVYVVVPGAATTSVVVALDALPQFLPLLEQAIGDAALGRPPGVPAPRCRRSPCVRRHTTTRRITGKQIVRPGWASRQHCDRS
jgi:hypothetical protein